jgi:hypothetical protein
MEQVELGGEHVKSPLPTLSPIPSILSEVLPVPPVPEKKISTIRRPGVRR